MEITMYTIGHSTHGIDEFIQILKRYEIQRVVDIRTIPKSRHNPQFNEASIQKSLCDNHIAYVHMTGLGGLRHTTKASINTAWKNLSFRGFADYMLTQEFCHSLEQLITIAKEKRTVIMCAESLPWHCHRSLVGDALLANQVNVVDILSLTSSRPHTLTPWAHIQGTVVSYPSIKQ